MGLLFRSVADAVIMASLFYCVLLLGGAIGLRQVSAASFSYLSILITLANFTFSILNIRIK